MCDRGFTTFLTSVPSAISTPRRCPKKSREFEIEFSYHVNSWDTETKIFGLDERHDM